MVLSFCVTTQNFVVGVVVTDIGSDIERLIVLYLSGQVAKYRHPRLGFMLTPEMWNAIPEGAFLAADNGCFTKPDSYSDEKYWDFLRRMPRNRTLFATAPDCVGDHASTVARSVPRLAAIKRLGHRPAFVAQDGFDELTTPWDEFDALFIGGTTEFKFRGGRDAAMAAKRRGKWVHMGRCNSLDRLRASISIGCDSADGTFLKFGPDKNWPKLKKWLDDRQVGFKW